MALPRDAKPFFLGASVSSSGVPVPCTFSEEEDAATAEEDSVAIFVSAAAVSTVSTVSTV